MGTFYPKYAAMGAYSKWLIDNEVEENRFTKSIFLTAYAEAAMDGQEAGIAQAKKEAAQLVTDLYQALKDIKGIPTFRDLIALRKRIKRIGKV